MIWVSVTGFEPAQRSARGLQPPPTLQRWRTPILGFNRTSRNGPLYVSKSGYEAKPFPDVYIVADWLRYVNPRRNTRGDDQRTQRCETFPHQLAYHLQGSTKPCK